MADNFRTAIDRVIEADKHEHEITRTQFQSHIDSTAQQHNFRERQDRLLESLRFEDINVRGNDISLSSHGTFRWVFGEASHSWDSLSKWLEQGQKVFWINGKAGSGKSTLMKFVVNDEHTSHALNLWSNGKDCMVLAFYFWLSGSKLQRSMKGFLCSLLRQIMSNNTKVLEDTFLKNELITRKRSVSDWSLSELKDILQFVVESVNRTGNICIFLDGIDEFDQDEDVQDLLDLVDELARFQNTKLCVSSRPDAFIEKQLSHYERLRLQDLTANDMKMCIKDTLDRVYEKYPPNSIEAKDIDDFTCLMTEKADGVFLWVQFALTSLLKGLRNEDDFQVLLMRLEELPSGMEQLYQQMWRRLNGDEQRYREEASTYFSYHDFFPLSLFEMTVALDDDIQKGYLRDLKPLSPAELTMKCEIQKTRILTRCAGLLEFATVIDNAGNSDYADSATTRSGSTQESLQDTQMQQETEEGVRSVMSRARLSESNESLKARGTTSYDLKQYHDMKIKFLHKTARDFLLGTKAGYAIAGGTSQSRDERFVNYTRARMATLLQGFTQFNSWSLFTIMKSVGGFDTEYEIDLLKELRQVCDALSIPGSPFHDITRRDFWQQLGLSTDFTGLTASCGYMKYVQFFVDHEADYVSPYYRGYLFLQAVSHRREVKAPKKLQLASWLAQNGADLDTRQSGLFENIEIPVVRLFEDAIDIERLISLNASMMATAKQIAQVILELFPAGCMSAKRHIVTLKNYFHS